MGWQDFLDEQERMKQANKIKLSNYAYQGDIGKLDSAAISRGMSALNRGAVAGTLGAPVDLVNEGLRAAGWGSEKPVGGSEWLGDRMQSMGMVSAERDPAAELAAGFVDPLSGVGSALKLAKGLPAVAGIFAGKSAKLADMASMLRAEKLLEEGHDAAAVWRETGWGKGPDGKWRFEIPDDTAKFDLNAVPPNQFNIQSAPVYDVLDHPELQANYPAERNFLTSVTHHPNEKVTSSYDSRFGFMDLSKGGIKEGSSIPFHELQHAVQGKEDFARGGSPKEFTSLPTDSPYPPEITPFVDEYVALRRALRGRDDLPRNSVGLHSRGRDLDEWYDSLERIKDPAIKKQFEEILNKIEIARDKVFGVNNGLIAQMSAEDQYRRLAGEAEARLTQSRLPLTAEQRLAQYPWEPDYFQKSTGVPLDQLIIRGQSE